MLQGARLAAEGDGGWSWLADPRAVQHNGKTYIGTIASDGDVLIYAHDHTTDTTSAATVLKAAMEVDDHDNPSILVRDSDKRILAFYTKHDLPPVYLRISTNPESVAAFGAEVDLNAQLGAGGVDYTYPVPIQLLGETNDPIHLFLRDIPSGTSTAKLVRSLSTDGGPTWAPRTTIFTSPAGQYGYWKMATNGTDRIDFAVTNGHPADTAASLYHFYYQGGNYYRSDGTQILSALPLTIADLTLVYDGSTTRCWVSDIALDPVTGDPIIVYPIFPSASAHRYNYARWDGTAWVNTVIVSDAGGRIGSGGSAAEAYYSGGIILDHADPSIVYASVKVGSAFEIIRYDTADDGATFTPTNITSGHTSLKNVRPFVPRNAAADLPVIWLAGAYTSYLGWNMAVRGDV